MTMTVHYPRIDTNAEVDIKALELLPADESEGLADQSSDSYDMRTCFFRSILRSVGRPESSRNRGV